MTGEKKGRETPQAFVLRSSVWKIARQKAGLGPSGRVGRKEVGWRRRGKDGRKELSQLSEHVEEAWVYFLVGHEKQTKYRFSCLFKVVSELSY